MDYAIFDEILDGPFQLTPRPEPIPGDLRRAWGITLILLMLYYSYGKRGSLKKLHFLAYATRTAQNRDLVRGVFDGLRVEDELMVRIEPWVNRALAFARGAALLHMEKGKSAQLTAKGALVVVAVLEDNTILTEERTFLEKHSRLATEDAVTRLMKSKV